jgi:hypothetical protein
LHGLPPGCAREENVTTALGDHPKSPVTLDTQYDPGLHRWVARVMA